jgi:hypothetical protein
MRRDYRAALRRQVRNASLEGAVVALAHNDVDVPGVRVDDARRASAWRYPAIHVDARGRVHVIWIDDRSGSGALYHPYSDDAGASF